MMRRKGMKRVTEAGTRRVTENCKAEGAEEKLRELSLSG